MSNDNPYSIMFPIGTRVKIASLSVLQEFKLNWHYHHKLTDQQLGDHDRVTKVTKTGLYHGGDIVYELQDIPGYWHDVCLRACGENDTQDS